MRKLVYIFVLCALGASAVAQDFSLFLSRVQSAPEYRRQFMADSFLTTLSHTPFIEKDSLCYFLFKGQALDVSIAGDHNNWSDTRSPLVRIAHTDLWYRSEVFNPSARIDYKIVADKAWILDPRNPRTIAGGFGPNSELRMSLYEEPREVLQQAGIPRGRLIDTTITSVELGNQRQVTVYLPEGYQGSSHAYPLLLVHDGPDYIRLAAVPTILDNLIHEGRIPPVIAVFVPPVRRTEEYAGSAMDAFSRFIVQELLPVLEARYRIRKDAGARAMIGASNGGNIGLYIAMRYPHVFGNVAAQSSNIIPAISDRFNQQPLLPLKLYLDLGVYDIPVLIPLVRSFAAQLQHTQYELLYQEFFEGHSWGNWRAHIDDALVWFFAWLLHSGDSPSPRSFGFEISAARPNPARDHLSFDVRLPAYDSVVATLHDTLGRVVRRVHDGALQAGSHTLTVETSALPRGTYFLRVTVDGHSNMRTIHLH
ncbi:MAG: alpha/beta hydrolase-fold protein [Bacteroidia bacterium]|nr:alpha/beta hydrolase-fold protein [Bacteroidia bacterium]